jgi:tRNA wybutosine-synthesizing protein 1
MMRHWTLDLIKVSFFTNPVITTFANPITFHYVEPCDADYLKKISFAVFGLGNAEYDENYCKAAKLIYNDLEALGAKPLIDVGLGDDNVDMLKAFLEWSEELMSVLKPGGVKKGQVPLKEYRRMKKEGNVVSNGKEDEEVEDKINEALLIEADKDFVENFDADRNDKTHKLRSEAVMEGEGDGGVVDLEDLGSVMKSSEEYAAKASDGVVRDMVTPAQRRALTKEGYKIIGTHSAVKLCRWTKNQLRGRGGCYKHTFYGITSYQCMEATPSLACANKCVFCWRHHKNPVGREWRWTTDDPERIITEAITKHQDMINQTKGVPGVIPERWKEAFTVRHCALSLVGEPIMYPHINRFLRLLHERNISSFLVTNAQFPEAIQNLDPCTQLYVSVDGATKQSLKAVDRPLFGDFWERYIACLTALNEKQQRTGNILTFWALMVFSIFLCMYTYI